MGDKVGDEAPVTGRTKSRAGRFAPAFLLFLSVFISIYIAVGKPKEVKANNTSDKFAGLLEEFKVIGLQEVLNLYASQSALFIDVRPKQSVAVLSIPGSISAAELELEGIVSENRARLSKAAAIILYCDQDCPSLHNNAIKHIGRQRAPILIYGGGISEWSRLGLPTVKR